MKKVRGLPEAWIAPDDIRELRELTRYRIKLAGLRTSGDDQVHAVLAKLGIEVTCTGIFGVWGNTWLDGLELGQPYAGKVASLRTLASELTAEITVLEAAIADLLAHHDRYHAIRGTAGHRPGPLPRCWWPRSATLPGSATRPGCARGPSRRPGTGSPMSRPAAGTSPNRGPRGVRWALMEAIQHVPAGHPLRQRTDGILARRGKEAKNIATVAAARQLLTWVFPAIRDGQVHTLAASSPKAAGAGPDAGRA